MKFKPLGKTDINLSAIIMGTWQAGKSMWVGIDDTESAKSIISAFDSGINAFDTAAGYGDGHSEKILGESLFDIRHEVIYATKVSPDQLRYNQVISSCHRSLKNLRTDYIDLFYIHWPSGSFGTDIVPVAETMSAMNDLRQKGKICAIGVSNFSYAQLKEASGYGCIDSLQFPYSLFWRHVEKEIVQYCMENNITILAYSPLAQGLLTGKYKPGHKFLKGDHRSKNRLFKSKYSKPVQDAIDKLLPLAERMEISLGQLALAWTISHQGTCAIAGARNSKQITENAKAGTIVLSDDILNKMDTIGRIVTDQLDDNPILWD